MKIKIWILAKEREEVDDSKDLASPEMRVSRIVLRAASSAGISGREFIGHYTEKDHY